MRENRRIYILALLAILAIGAVLLFALLGRDKTQQAPLPHLDSPGTVVIDNTDGLREILLQRQYAAVNEELVKYIQTKVGKSVDHAEIIGNPDVSGDGVVLFTVQTDSPTQKFNVKVDRNTYFNKIVFTVVGSDYQTTTDVYATEEIGE